MNRIPLVRKSEVLDLLEIIRQTCYMSCCSSIEESQAKLELMTHIQERVMEMSEDLFYIEFRAEDFDQQESNISG